MTFIEFMHEHWFVTLCIAYMAYVLLVSLFFRLPNRILRSVNIRKHGWPPAHLDADGDFKSEEKEDAA